MAVAFQVYNKARVREYTQIPYGLEWSVKNVLVTGANGQLGKELRRLASGYLQFRFLFTDIEELDITNKDALATFVKQHNIHYIVNCAAYTAVDKAEDDQASCFRINRDGAALLAQVAAEEGAKLLHVSTDYVFDGDATAPYKEDDLTDPKSVYGKSKLAGEQAVLFYCPESMIVRTSWLYSSFGNNFVKTMIRLGKEKRQLSVVSDQTGSPTYAADLAEVLLLLLAEGELLNFIPGIYHFSNEGVCSWSDFAATVLRLYGNEETQIVPIASEEYPAKAPRPRNSVFDKDKIKTTYQIVIPRWEESLKECIDELKKAGY